MRIRRHLRPDPDGLSLGVGWRRVLRDGALVAAVFAIGYVISAWWVSPSPLLGGDEHLVPRVLGLPEADARERLTGLGLRPRIGGERPHPTRQAGAVIWQDPPPDVVLSPNGVVTLVLSAGPAPVPVPDVIGLDRATAGRILGAANLKVGEVTRVVGGREADVVIATRPATGVARPRGATVDLVVSRGPEVYP